MKPEPRQAANRIRVMVVDDHALMREGLRTLLGSQPDLSVVAEAESGPIAIQLLSRIKTDVVLMDNSMPEMTGAETTRRLRQLRPEAKIIGLTLYQESAYLKEMVASGAKGYVVKSGPPENLLHAVRAVAAGGTYFDPVVPGADTPSVPSSSAAPVVQEALSADELAVAKLLAEGCTNAEIATALRLPLPSVAAHRTGAMTKLGVRNRAELARIAAQRRWLAA